MILLKNHYNLALNFLAKLQNIIICYMKSAVLLDVYNA